MKLNKIIAAACAAALAISTAAITPIVSNAATVSAPISGHLDLTVNGSGGFNETANNAFHLSSYNLGITLGTSTYADLAEAIDSFTLEGNLSISNNTGDFDMTVGTAGAVIFAQFGSGWDIWSPGKYGYFNADGDLSYYADSTNYAYISNTSAELKGSALDESIVQAVGGQIYFNVPAGAAEGDTCSFDYSFDGTFTVEEKTEEPDPVKYVYYDFPDFVSGSPLADDDGNVIISSSEIGIDMADIVGARSIIATVDCIAPNGWGNYQIGIDFGERGSDSFNGETTQNIGIATPGLGDCESFSVFMAEYGGATYRIKYFSILDEEGYVILLVKPTSEQEITPNPTPNPDVETVYGAPAPKFPSNVNVSDFNNVFYNNSDCINAANKMKTGLLKVTEDAFSLDIIAAASGKDITVKVLGEDIYVKINCKNVSLKPDELVNSQQEPVSWRIGESVSFELVPPEDVTVAVKAGKDLVGQKVIISTGDKVLASGKVQADGYVKVPNSVTMEFDNPTQITFYRYSFD